jgi:hypothetical protein
VSVRTVTLSIVALAAIAMLRIFWLHFISEPAHEPMRARIDRRYEGVREVVSGRVAGYISDLPAAVHFGEDPTTLGTRMYLEAQFGLAPILLRHGDDRAQIVIVNVADPSRLPELLRRHQLVLQAEPAPGLAVARPR